MASNESQNPPWRAVTPRALLLGLVLIPINAYWTMVAELRWYMILTLNPLFVTPIFFLLLLLGVNAILRFARPASAFSVPELLTVYIMLAVSCTVCTHDFVINLMGMIGWGAWFATPENRWEDLIFPHMPRWPLVWDRDALRGYFEGAATPYDPDVLLPWLGPLAIWIGFMLVMFGVMFCLNAMVRRAWIEDTKLSFPIVRLPLAMVGLESAGFFRSRLMFIGAVLPVLSGTLNGLAQIFPTLPHFQTRARWHFFTNPPWNRVSGTPTSFYPFAIGLGYFVPLDVLFSCWFFYVFIKVQRLLGYYVGVTRLPGYPFVTEQGIGAWTTYGLLILYLQRRRWRRLMSDILSNRSDDAGELLPYRQAFAGALVGIGILVGFWRAAGMTLLPAVIAVGAYFLLAICITRVRAEAGSQHTVWDLEPMRLFALTDTRHLGEGNIIGAGISHWFWRLNRSHAMPTQLEALKIWHAGGLTPRSLALPIIAATIAACIAGPWACLHVTYREGAAAKCIGFARWTGIEMYRWLTSALSGGRPVQWPRIAAVGAAC
ncbi:MAG: DUF6785 family protein, partial [Armatimonadota bacterium]